MFRNIALQVSDAYDHLPVAYVTNWEELLGDEEKGKLMQKSWIEKLSPYYVENSALRRKTLHVRTIYSYS